LRAEVLDNIKVSLSSSNGETRDVCLQQAFVRSGRQCDLREIEVISSHCMNDPCKDTYWRYQRLFVEILVLYILVVLHFVDIHMNKCASIQRCTSYIMQIDTTYIHTQNLSSKAHNPINFGYIHINTCL
jgi:hypothetical protein